MKDEDNVEYIEEETVITISDVPWHLDRTDQQQLPLDNIFSPLCPNRGAGVDIYILDTGN